MKILHTEASCGWGGQEIRILEEARGLIGRGHEVSIACPQHARIAEEAPRFGVPITPLPIEFKTLAGFFALRKHIASLRPQVVNSHSSADSWLTALACATISQPPSIVRTRHISAKVAGNPFNQWLYRSATAVVTTGLSLRRHLIERLALEPSRVRSIPTGIDMQRFAPSDKEAARQALGLDPSHRYIGIVATLRSWKGHLFLLDAFARLKRPDLRLVIVGDGPLRGPIEERVAALGLADRIVLTGQRNDPERWLPALDIFCLPSYANEGVPQALLQAMACRLPIVTTPVGAILEAVTDGESALVVPPKDSVALADALERLLDNPGLAGALGAKAYGRANADYSLPTMLDGMETTFAIAASQ